MTPGEPKADMSVRQAHGEAAHERLLGPRDDSAPEEDPELKSYQHVTSPDMLSSIQ